MNFTVNEVLNRPAFAVFVSIELLTAFTANSAILLLTFIHIKSLKEPSAIFLTAWTISNLIIAVLYLPFTVITTISGEWIFGNNDQQKQAMCQFVGFIFTYSIGLSIHLLALISCDRCLFIVKPLFYRRHMNTKIAVTVTLVVAVWCALLDTTPFFGLGEYVFSDRIGSCVTSWESIGYVLYFTLYSTIPFGALGISTICTCVHTHSFFKRRHSETITQYTNEERRIYCQSVYNHKVCNVIGIFGCLIIIDVICFTPYIIVSVSGMIFGLNNIPLQLYPLIFVIFMLHIVVNPIVQGYFRQTIRLTVINMFCKSCFDKEQELTPKEKTLSVVV